jgi:hypothetical protein
MRRLWMLYLTLGLVATQGCHKTMQHTAGVCDCYPPPVESLLVAPCPSGGHDGHGPYARAPHAGPLGRNGDVAPPDGGILKGTPPKVIEKSSNDPGKVIEKPNNANGPVVEPIRSLPKIADPK